MALYEAVLRGEFEMPSGASPAAKDLINALLQEQPSLRLGIVRRGHRDLLAHKFFNHPFGVDMHALPRRSGTPAPPHVPRIASNTDTSNFDAAGDEQDDANVDPAWLEPPSDEEQKLFYGFGVPAGSGSVHAT